ncbi:MAG: cyanoexosortase B system-associated protein [Okeania sp. SIO2D1]|nr:cyanoexosortase B system-associated protein [Okeania sp. SIO2D1]
MASVKHNKRSFSFKVILKFLPLLLLLILVTFKALPSYFANDWSWRKPPAVTNLKQIRELRQKGIDLPGWETLKQVEGEIGGNTWSIQFMQKDQQPEIFLLLRPQADSRNQPEVDWVDIRGEINFTKVVVWEEDYLQKLKFTFTGPSEKEGKVTTRFFRALTNDRTLGVVQWYAFPNGGHLYPSRWFWADQFAQLKQKRVPWVAVCLGIAMEPYGDLDEVKPLALDLAKQVQSVLSKEVFSS